MLNEILKNKYQLAIIGILVMLLVCIRLFETKIFYDPFLDFFKTDFQNKELPDYESFKLYFNLLLRYFLNTAISIGILHVLFKDKNITKLSLVLFIFIFIVLITLFVIELNFVNDYLILFYTRRFLIQPIFLILFIPAFYYQKLNR